MAWYSKHVERYISFLQKRCLFVVIFWVLLACAGVFLAPRFMKNTTSTIDAPPNSGAHKAATMLRNEFPTLSGQFLLIFVVRDKKERDVRGLEELAEFSQQLNVLANSSPHRSAAGPIQSYWNIESFGQQANVSLNTLADMFVSNKTKHVTFFSVALSGPEADGLMNDLKSGAHGIISEVGKGDFVLEVTGEEAFYQDIRTGAEKDLELVDGIALPIALLVLGYVLRSIRLVIMPLVSIATAVSVSFSLMFGVSHLINVISVTPSLMMSLNIALSIDYSLFLFSRFIEELRDGALSSTAMSRSLLTAGETILVSGSTLAICFLGLTILPLTLLQTMGIGAGCAVITSMCVSLSFIPSLVFLFPTFFGNALNNNIFSCCQSKNSQNFQSYRQRLNSRMETTPSDTVEELSKSRWYKLTQFTIKHRVAILVLLLLTAIPFLWLASQMTTSLEITLSVPRTSESVKGYNTLKNHFSAGYISPYKLLLINTTGSALSKPFFEESQRILEKILTVQHTHAQDLLGLVCFDGSFVTFEQYQQSQLNPIGSELDVTLNLFKGVYVNNQASSQFVNIQLGFDPFSAKGKAWLRQARSVIKEIDTPLSVYLAKGAAVNIDGIDLVYQLLPVEMAVTAVIVFVLMTIAFRSVIVPIRSISSIGLTLAWTYGLATLTFNMGMLDWLGWDSLGKYDGISWFTPVMCFSVLTGFGLDYDIFLLTRIVEFRLEGYTDFASIKLAVFKTGGIITAAGCIMAIAFGGLLLSSMPLLNMCSFFITFSVLFDTFVVRTILVPAAMAILGKWNFWPRELPTATMDEGVTSLNQRTLPSFLDN